MGAVLLATGSLSDATIHAVLGQMVARSPYRGTASMREIGGVAMAVQSLGWDASLACSESLVVGFHGFVGNWREILGSCGMKADPSADHAEITALAFGCLGDDLFRLLRGEFALVIHDLRRNRVIAARDPVGCRPLYYLEYGNLRLVASEIRQIVAGAGKNLLPNDRALVAHIVNLPQLNEDTLVSHVRCLLPGHIYSLDSIEGAGCFSRTPYWEVKAARFDRQLSEDDWLSELSTRFRRSVERWLPSHRFGLALSGGLDSSAIWSQVCELSKEGNERAQGGCAVSLVFPGFDCDERDYICRILSHTGRRGITIDGTSESATSLRPWFLRHLDTVSFRTAYFLYLLARTAARENMPTVMTGMFGDHWFDILPITHSQRAGYLARVILQDTLGAKFAALVYPSVRQIFKRNKGEHEFYYLEKQWQKYVKYRRWERATNQLTAYAVIEQRVAHERTGWSMQSWEQIGAVFGVEFRHPFSDVDLIEMAPAYPVSLRDSGESKPAMRALIGSKLPEEIVVRPDKTVFDSLLQRCHAQLAAVHPHRDWYLVTRGILNPEALDRSLEAANTGDGEALREVLWLEEVEAFAQSCLRGD